LPEPGCPSARCSTIDAGNGNQESRVTSSGCRTDGCRRKPASSKIKGSCVPVQIGACGTQYVDVKKGAAPTVGKGAVIPQSCPTRGEGLPVNGRKEAENRRSDCRSGGVPVPGVRRSILATAMPRLHTQRPRQCHGHGNATSKATPRAPKVGTDRRIGLVLPTQTTATAMPRAHAPEPGGWSLSLCRWFG
jgi:hypothetical protein